jgi:hypothetical protein
VNHKSKDSHHGGTSLVKLDGTLLKLGLLIERVPSEVDGSVTEISNEFTRLGTVGGVFHDEKLKESDESNNLEKSSLGDGLNGGVTIGDGVEGSSGVVDVSWKVNSGTGDDVSKEGKLGNTSVLDLNVTKTVESVLVSFVKKSKRIEESKRSLNSELVLKGLKGGGGLGNLGRSEGGSGGDKGGKDKLHVEISWFRKIVRVQTKS